MDKEALKAQWAAFAPEWIARINEKRDVAREGILDDWMLRLCGDVTGLNVVDLGCGEGRFCRMLSARGARTLGIDLQHALIARANELRGQGQEYRLGDIETLAGVPDASFDLAISYITLVDVADMAAVLRNTYRVLRPGGRFIVASLSPMATGKGPWLRDAQNRKLHYVLDDYASEGPRDLPFSSGSTFVLTNFHRTMSSMINGFIAAGFTIRALHEPTPTPEQLARVPANEDLLRVPIFVVYELARA